MGTKYTVHNELRELDLSEFDRRVDGMLDLDAEETYTKSTTQAAAAVEILQAIREFDRRVASDLTVRARSRSKISVVGIKDEKDAKELKENLNNGDYLFIRSVETDKSLTGDKWALVVEGKPPT